MTYLATLKYKLAVMAKVASPMGFVCICHSSVYFSICYRYALICQQCFSHNGMALKEEFEYIGKNYWAFIKYFTLKYFIICQSPCNIILFLVLSLYILFRRIVLILEHRMKQERQLIFFLTMYNL